MSTSVPPFSYAYLGGKLQAVFYHLSRDLEREGLISTQQAPAIHSYLITVLRDCEALTAEYTKTSTALKAP